MSEKIEINTLITEVGKLVSLLNELVTKCHKLEGELEESSAFIIEQRKENKTLKEENEQLKKEYKIAIDEMVTDYKKLEKENEQLRKQLDFYLLDEFEWKEKYGD